MPFECLHETAFLNSSLCFWNITFQAFFSVQRTTGRSLRDKSEPVRVRDEGAVKIVWGEAQVLFFFLLVTSLQPCSWARVQQAWLCSASFSSTTYIIKTMTRLEVKVLFNKYNFHKPFSKQLLTKLYKEQAHSLAVRGAKIT